MYMYREAIKYIQRGEKPNKRIRELKIKYRNKEKKKEKKEKRKNLQREMKQREKGRDSERVMCS